MKSIFIIIPIILFVVIASGYVVVLSSFDENSINLDMGRQVGDVNTSLGSPMLGSASAPVTIIEFGDYQCPKCKEWFLSTKPDIVTNYIDTGKANLIFVDIAFLGKDSIPAARATYCANDQKKYWDYHSMLFQNSIENKIDANLLKQFATELGLDIDSFEECLDSEKYEKKVKYSYFLVMNC